MREFLSKIHTTIGNIIFGSRSGLALGIVAAIAPIVLIALAYNAGTKQHPSRFTVMITNFSGNSGGSGVVIQNTLTKSLVLTNKHVCKLVATDGGLVKNESGSYSVTATYASKQHDLCVISVAADLKNSVKVASGSPELYSDATVTGHPGLLPDVITKGYFGDRRVIQVITEVKKCSEENITSEQDLQFCMFFGAIPVFESFESQVVSALIQAGSSGSAVLNSNNELSGLVFAGSGDGLSYAYVVPYEYIISFLYGEFDIKAMTIPNPNDKTQKKGSQPSLIRDVISKCESNNNLRLKLPEICKILRRDATYRGN